MAVKFGRAKHIEKITLTDCLRYPIWVSAHDDRHDEEWQKPVVSTTDVCEEVLRVDNPIITFRGEASDLHGVGSYDPQGHELYGIALWIDGTWVIAEHAEGVSFPMSVVAIPTIKGEAEVRFDLAGAPHFRAVRRV